MKNFNLFLAFLVCSSVAIASTDKATPAAGAAASVKTETKDSLSTTVYNWTVKPVVNAATAVDGYVAQADAQIISTTKAAKDGVVNFVKPATDKIASVTKPATDKVSSISQEAYAQLSAFAQRPVAMIIAAAAISATYYAYTQYNSTDENSKN